MSAVVRRVLFSLAVLFWAGCILYFYNSGRIVKYLAPDFRTIALAGGLGLAVLGLFNLLTAFQKADCGHDHGGEGHDHEGGDMNPFTALLLMVVPVALCVAWTKDGFSEATLSRKGLYDDGNAADSSVFLASVLPALTMEEIESSHRKTSDGFLEFSLIELFFATGDRELQDLISGLKVETEGRIIQEKVNNESGTRMRLYRMFMTCCVADSRAIPVILEFGSEPPVLPENGWVKVAGTMTFPEEDGTLRAVLEVERATAAEVPPEEKFLIK
ncbi:TIGR03943 family putative permease subunit [Luteolibacter sp. AS25]|uniref:TIGR03943 family putative permease subunit n=1 Tax=Luteolibacter sp. AS25 TaxID=3135776 RepID=UPI00398B8924